ncbi:preprotein translocase subunit SecG [Bacteroidetes/Chlorobi group bacterium ChocPot_Mid]|jgi:protein translocase SecG subunit|nr:MAG: preprotein translocase subunit SecG [Bacteroidetes/Chlorobi group bacterium ChocPot_Mid]
MYTVLIILILFGAILMIAVVLLQPGKGDLTATFGGLSSQFGAVFGMQRANDLLAKVTKWIAAIILILILLTNKFFVSQDTVKEQLKPVTEGASVPAQQAPGNLAPPPVTPKPGDVPQE